MEAFLFLGFVLLAGVLLVAGWGLLGRAPVHLAFQAGAVLLLVLLTALDGLGVPWTRTSLSLALLPFLVSGFYWMFGRTLLGRDSRGGGPGIRGSLSDRWKRRWGWGWGWRSRWPWGSALALAAVAVFAYGVWHLWSTNPDFIYHWGIKGRRFYLAQGIDTDYLTRPWNHHAHPGYPHLHPMLFVATALVQGGWYEPWLLLWSPLAVFLCLLPCREAMATIPAVGGGAFLRAGTPALVVMVTALFSLGHTLAGGPDLFLTLALLTAAPALMRSSPAAGDARAVAVAAAFAAGSKTEGVVLAALLLSAFVLHTWRTVGPPWRRGPQMVGLAFPTVVVVTPWLVTGLRLGLFTEPNSGPFAPANAPLVLPALLESLVHPQWYGFALVAVLGIPLLLITRRTRMLAAMAASLLLFYGATYFTARVGADFWVRSSFPRILVHGVPALLLGLGVWALQASAVLEEPDPEEDSALDPDLASGLPSDLPSEASALPSDSDPALESGFPPDDLPA